MIKNVSENEVDDLISVCTPVPKDEEYKVGIELKKHWTLEMIRKYGSIAKIAYFKGKPVAQLLYYPASADPAMAKRDDILVLHCIFNPIKEAQQRGIAKLLVESLLNDVKKEGKYRFIVTHAFETGVFYSQREFLMKMGFKQIPSGSKEDLYYSVKGEQMDINISSFWKSDAGEYKPLEEDKGIVLIFYSPVCQFSYVFSCRAAAIVREVNDKVPIRMLNYWEHINEYVKRGMHWMLANAKPIKSTVFDKEKFKEELSKALSS
jgi:GNAT superfamily N-acetyltransferase